MKLTRNPWGSIEVTDRGVEIRGIGERQFIPFARINSVSANRFTNRLRIETGAQTHEFSVWNTRRLPELAAEIEKHLD